MRYTQTEKMEIIRLVEESDLPVKRTLEELDVPRSTFYRWYNRYQQVGYEGLADQPQPGTSACQTKFSVLLHRSGSRGLSSATPIAVGPRNRCQLLSAQTDEQRMVTTNRKVILCILMTPNRNTCS